MKKLPRTADKAAETKPSAGDETSWSCERRQSTHSQMAPSATVQNYYYLSLRCTDAAVLRVWLIDWSEKAPPCSIICFLRRRAAVWQLPCTNSLRRLLVCLLVKRSIRETKWIFLTYRSEEEFKHSLWGLSVCTGLPQFKAAGWISNTSLGLFESKASASKLAYWFFFSHT